MSRRVSSLDKSTAGIERDINSQYDKVKTVAENIEDVQRLANSADNIDIVVNDAVNIDTVALNISDVNTVSSNIDVINTFVNSAGSVDIVAADIDSVVTVATEIEAIKTASADLNEAISEIETVANDLNNSTSAIETVAFDIANVNTVATNKLNIDTVADDIVNINAVANNKTNIDTVAAVNTNVTTLAGLTTELISTYNNRVAIESAYANRESIATIGTIDADIQTIASISTAISSLYTDKVALDSLYADKITLDSLYADKAKLDSLYTDINAIASLYADKAKLDSLFADKTTLDSLYADKTKLDSLYADKAALDSLYADKTTLDRIYSSINNIDRVYTSIANIDTVSDSANNVDTVAANINNVNFLSGNFNAVDIVSSDLSSNNIRAVGSVQDVSGGLNDTPITLLLGPLQASHSLVNVNSLIQLEGFTERFKVVEKGLIGNITSLDVNTIDGTNSTVVLSIITALVSGSIPVTANLSSIENVAALESEIVTVAGISSDITTVVDNIVDIQNAEENATIAVTKASEASNSASDALNLAASSVDVGFYLTSDTGHLHELYSALHYATKAAGSAGQADQIYQDTAALLDAFSDQYLGPLATEPTVDLDGDPLTAGDIYWNTTTSELYFYTGTEWVAPDVVATTAANNAEDAYADATKLATNAEDTSFYLHDDTGSTTPLYSALHYAAKANASASAASVSEGNAADSADLAAQLYDTFDDLFLGVKTEAPTTDNDGDPLQVGALYFDSSAERMRTWNGTAWFDSFISIAGVLMQDQNLSDLTDFSQARTNLGLGTAATTNSTEYLPAVTNITALNDVNSLISASANDLLVWDNTNSNWTNKTFDAVTPVQTDNAGKFLTTNGTTSSWAAPFDQTVNTTDNVSFNDVTTNSVTTTATASIGTNLTVGGTIAVGNADDGEGVVAWDETKETLTVTLGNGVVQQIGEEIYYPKNTRNMTGLLIPNGTPVMMVGGAGEDTYIAPAIASSAYDADYYIGIATEDIADQAYGRITFFGSVNDIDTSAYAKGTLLYVSDTVAGGFTTVRPKSPSHSILAAIVTKSDATNGRLFVRTHVNPEASEINYSNTDSGLVATNIKSAIDELQETKADVSLLSSNIILYPTTAPSNVVGYNKLVTSPSDPDYNTTAVDVSTGVISTDNQLVGALIADAGLFIGNPGIISIPTIGNIAKVAGNGEQFASFYFTVSIRNEDGTETLISTSSSTGAINPEDSDYNQFSATALFSNGDWLATDRLVIKFYAHLLGNTGSSYTFQFGGNSPVYTNLPVPVSVIPSDLAEDILVDTTNFDGILSTNDSTVQLALDTIDNHGHSIAAISGLQTALDDKVDDSQVLTDVPANALFTDTNYYLTGLSFDAGILTATVTGATDVTVSLDGRYLQSYTETSTLDDVTGRGATTTNNVSIGSLSTTSINIDTEVTLDTSKVNITTDLQNVVDTFDATTHRSAKYLAQVTNGTNYQVTELLVIHDGTNAYATQYGTIETNIELGTFDAEVAVVGADTVVRLLYTPVAGSTDVTLKISRTSITI